MREFSKKEKNLIKKFLRLKNDNDIVGLQVAKFIRESLDCFALKYQTKDKPQIVFYSKSKDDDINKVNHNYITICDFIYFLQELEQYGFIKFQRNVSTMLNNSNDNYVLLFDRDKYKYNEEEDNFTHLEDDEVKEIEFLGKKWTLSPFKIASNIDKVYLDFVKDLVIYGNAIIYPLPLLEDFVNHDFKDLERIMLEETRNFNRETISNTNTTLEETRTYNKKSLSKTDEALKQTRYSIGISAFAVVISCIAIIAPILYEAFWSNSPNSADMRGIKTAIEQNRNISIDAINTDTLNVKVTNTSEKQPINLNVTVKENQPTKIQ